MLAPPKLKAWHWSGKRCRRERLLSPMKMVFVLQGQKSPVGGRSAFSVKDRDLSFGLRKVGYRVNRRGSRCRLSGRSGSFRVSGRSGRCRVNGRSSRCRVSGRSGRCRVSGSSRRGVSERSSRCRASGRSSRCRVEWKK